MPLFSLISGFSICLSFQTKNSIRSYFTERFHKLVIPFLASEVFLVLPNSYILARDYQGSFMSYLLVDFWISHFAVYHLWWILYLLVISVLNIFFFQWLLHVKTSFMNSDTILSDNIHNRSFNYLLIQIGVVLLGCFTITKLSFPSSVVWHIIIVYGTFMLLPYMALKSKDPKRNFAWSAFFAVITFIISRMIVVTYYQTIEIPTSLFSIITWGIHVVALNHFILLGFFVKLFEPELAAIINKLNSSQFICQ